MLHLAAAWLLVAMFLVSNSSMSQVTFNKSHKCVCQKSLLSQKNFIHETGDELNCVEKCKNLASEIETPSSSKNQDIEDAVRCIKDGKEYNPGIVWREHCKEFTCMKNGEILVKNVGCKEICVLKESKMAQCCPICKRKISCNPREIKIEIPRPMLRNKDLLVLSLSDPKCKPIVNKTHVTFRTKLAACRTKFKKTRKGFVYTNTVKKSYSVIVRPLFKFSCLLTVKQAHSNVLASFKVNRPIVHSMRMVYTDSSGKALKKSPTNKEVMEGQPVFVQIAVHEKLQPDRYLVLERCQILSINRKKAYPLLESGCPIDSTLKILTKKQDKIWFSFQAKVLAKGRALYSQWFNYQSKRFHPNDREYVDLSCQAAVCSTKSVGISICNRQCKT